jgi:hypothetical protein
MGERGPHYCNAAHVMAACGAGTVPSRRRGGEGGGVPGGEGRKVLAELQNLKESKSQKIKGAAR